MAHRAAPELSRRMEREGGGKGGDPAYDPRQSLSCLDAVNAIFFCMGASTRHARAPRARSRPACASAKRRAPARARDTASPPCLSAPPNPRRARAPVRPLLQGRRVRLVPRALQRAGLLRQAQGGVGRPGGHHAAAAAARRAHDRGRRLAAAVGAAAAARWGGRVRRARHHGERAMSSAAAAPVAAAAVAGVWRHTRRAGRVRHRSCQSRTASQTWRTRRHGCPPGSQL